MNNRRYSNGMKPGQGVQGSRFVIYAWKRILLVKNRGSEHAYQYLLHCHLLYHWWKNPQDITKLSSFNFYPFALCIVCFNFTFTYDIVYSTRQLMNCLLTDLYEYCMECYLLVVISAVLSDCVVSGLIKAIFCDRERRYDENLEAMLQCVRLSHSKACADPKMQLKITALLSPELCVSHTSTHGQGTVNLVTCKFIVCLHFL